MVCSFFPNSTKIDKTIALDTRYTHAYNMTQSFPLQANAYFLNIFHSTSGLFLTLSFNRHKYVVSYGERHLVIVKVLFPLAFQKAQHIYGPSLFTVALTVKHSLKTQLYLFLQLQEMV